MFSLTLVTCVLGFICDAQTPDYAYATAERCHEQAAIIAGMAKTSMPRALVTDTFGWTATCINQADRSVSVTKGGADPEDLKAANTQLFQLDLDSVEDTQP